MRDEVLGGGLGKEMQKRAWRLPSSQLNVMTKNELTGGIVFR
jgi:hypothetical protein